MSEEKPRDSTDAPASRFLEPSKAALTKAAILDTAHSILETRPFRDLTVGTLMKATGLSRPTFYLYFNDLHSLMETLLDEAKGGIIEGARTWLACEGDAVTELQNSLRAVVDVGFEHGTILKAVSDAATRDERLEIVWETFLSSFDHVVSARIEHDQQNGITPEFNSFHVARALNRMDAAILIKAFGTPKKDDKDAVLSAILRVWLSTLYPFDARAAIQLSKG
ncbi:TetR/AcrR family transcriptional regulator [Tateyamaria sp. Alg231-49]|uniref:TetR/AcrR family transcriptional regulator n=2 Tax=unclassified Tateyamaria TaxID=2645127 RepID=UPI000D556455|nr:TetR/AcrR family transcriptional regulator [Tateyamaria sp. Alg231-49]